MASWFVMRLVRRVRRQRLRAKDVVDLAVLEAALVNHRRLLRSRTDSCSDSGHVLPAPPESGPCLCGKKKIEYHQKEGTFVGVVGEVLDG